MINALSTPRNRLRTLILLGICGLLAIAAASVGISDNPPGILLAFLAATAFVLAFVHPWRTSRQLRRLLYASLLGFALFVILNELFEAFFEPAGLHATNPGALDHVLNGLALAVFFLSAAGIIVGVVGSVTMFVRGRRRPPSSPPTDA